MMETLEDAPDPFFGMMSVDPRLPSPFDIPQVGLIPLEHLLPVQKGVLFLCQSDTGLKGRQPAIALPHRTWCQGTVIMDPSRQAHATYLPTQDLETALSTLSSTLFPLLRP